MLFDREGCDGTEERWEGGGGAREGKNEGAGVGLGKDATECKKRRASYFLDNTG
jgi:hypothetical protein